MNLPQVNVIKPDIKNLSIYIRSTKKFGKSTLYRDVILQKYHDPRKGLLVACGHELGYKLLDNLNYVHVESWKDLKDLAKWLISEKGKSHNIEIIAFDTVDELALLADAETIRLSNIENPKKPVKSIKAAFGGYTAGEKYSANNLIKPYMSTLQEAGFGVWAIAHTKFKTIKEKGGLDEDGYQQLSSNLSADYESAFGDIFDVTLTGVIDRNIEEIGEGDKVKRRATDTIRKLYFRETPVIDAGGRFAFGAVPEYMVFDKPNMAEEFIKVIEDGMEKSKLDVSYHGYDVKESNEDEYEEESNEMPVIEEEPTPDPDPIIPDEEESAPEVDIPALQAQVRKLIKANAGTDKYKKAAAVVKEYGNLSAMDVEGLNKVIAILEE